MRQILVAGALLAAAVAGCAGAVDTVPAKTGLQAAYDAASAHGADPVLVAVQGVEPFHASGQGDAATEPHVAPDGHAPTWTYTFRDGERTIEVRYAARGGVTVEVDDADHHGFPLQVDRWLLDAPEAAHRLSGMAGWPPGGEATGGVEWHLFQSGRGPIWSVAWEEPSGTSGFWVDAATGNLTQPAVGLGQVFCASVHSPGGPVTSTTEVSLSQGVGDGGSLQYAYQWRVAVDEVLAQVEGPTGVVHDVRLRGSGSHQDEVSDLDAGTYTLRFSTEKGAGTVSGLAVTSCT